jgi:hypothetical protein
MASTPEDDGNDPTHALDDFVRRMHAPPAAPPPDLSGIGRSLHAGPAPAAPRGGVLRSGERWSAADVEDVPLVALPRNPPPVTTLPTIDLPGLVAAPPADEAGLAAGLRHVRAAAAAQEAVDDRPAWQPDPVALQLRPAVQPRLLAHWQPGAWACAVRHVCDGHNEVVTTPQGPVVESFAPQRLLLLWQPRADTGPPGRWPHSAWLLAADADADPATAAALALVPGDARVWPLADTADVDWALGAELALHHTAGLRPFQIDGLRAFIDAERAQVFARLNSGYRQATPGGAVQRA